MINAALCMWGGDLCKPAGTAKVYDGVMDYDTASILTISPNNTIEFIASIYTTKNTGLQYFFDTRDDLQRGGFTFLINEGLLGIVQTTATDSSNRNVFSTDLQAITGAGYYIVQFTQTGTTNIRIWVNGVEFSVTRTQSATLPVTTGNNIKIGVTIINTPLGYFSGLIRKMQFLDTLQSDVVRAQAAQAGSYENLVSDDRFLLDIDTNHTNGQNLTTRTNTPTYTITANGGSQYQDFCNPPTNYLLGNAQVFDGSFDFNRISGWTGIDYTGAFSINFNLNILSIVGSHTWLFQGATNPTNALTMEVFQYNSVLWITCRTAETTNEMRIINIPISAGKQSVIINKAAGTDANDFTIYVQGGSVGFTINKNTLSSYIANPDILTIGATHSQGQKMNANLKILEILNREATAQEISGAYETGSFQGGGVSHDSGDYLLAVDFDKTDGQNPTTYTNTPTYTIAPTGGSEYVNY